MKKKKKNAEYENREKKAKEENVKSEKLTGRIAQSGKACPVGSHGIGITIHEIIDETLPMPFYIHQSHRVGSWHLRHAILHRIST